MTSCLYSPSSEILYILPPFVGNFFLTSIIRPSLSAPFAVTLRFHFRAPIPYALDEFRVRTPMLFLCLGKHHVMNALNISPHRCIKLRQVVVSFTPRQSYPVERDKRLGGKQSRQVCVSASNGIPIRPVA
jgi:hypothetical protein